MKHANPQFLADVAQLLRRQQALLHRRKRVPQLAGQTLSESLGEQQLQTLLHVTVSLPGKAHRQDLPWIRTVTPN